MSAVVESMSPSLYHSAIAINIGGELVKQKEFRAHSELTVVIDGTDYQPDISVYKRKKLHYISELDEPKTEELPLLAIKIVSPSQTMNELIKKADFYVGSGIQSVWIVHPQTHSITAKTQSETNIYHEGILEDITGINVDLAVIFED
ncbi:MAG: Uma2 family endonuclease [Candidatus Electrothrix sp. EH2]|nr:Uma2 family endonuclease [Candidatus Electrothrix sp. EH2]